MAISQSKVVAFFKGIGTDTAWADQSGNNRNGVVSGITSAFKKSFKSDVITFPANSGGRVTVPVNGSFSLSMYVKMDGPTGGGVFDNAKMTVNMSASRTVQVLFEDNTTKKESNVPLPLNVWVHLFVDQKARKIYVNGIDVTKDLATSWGLSGFTESYIGKGYYGTTPYSLSYCKILDGTTEYSIDDIKGELLEAKATITGLKYEYRDMVLYDAILMKYTASVNAVGAMGIARDVIPPNILPAAPTDVPNGSFYAYLVDIDKQGRFVLAADRNIQSKISWDTLNAAGVASGVPISNIRNLRPPNAVYEEVEYVILSYTNGYSVGPSILTDGADPTGSGVYFYNYSIEVDILNDCNLWLMTPSGYPTYGDGSTIKAEVWNGSSYITYKDSDKKPASAKWWKAITLPKGRYRLSAGTSQPLIAEWYLESVRALNDKVIVKLPSGGLTAVDKENDWDRYIVSGIGAGDNSVWNWSGVYSYTSTTAESYPDKRVYRASSSVTNNSTGLTTDASNVAYGFRPFFLVEVGGNRFLIQDGTDIKTFEGGQWITIGTAPITDSMVWRALPDLRQCLPFLDRLVDKSKAKIHVLKSEKKQSSLSVLGVPTPRVVHMKNDISFLHASNVDSITLTGAQSGGGVVRVAVSFDSGKVWESLVGSTWTTVDTANTSDFKTNGMSIAKFNSVTNWLSKIGAGNKMRLAFYLEQQTVTDVAYMDEVSLQLDLKGSWDVATQGVDYKYGYNSNTNLRVLLMSDGDFKINFGGGGGGSSITEVDGGTF